MAKLDFPYKQMFGWKTGNLALTVIALFYLVIPIWRTLTTRGVPLDQGMVIFGMTFLCVSLVKAKASPTVLGGVFTAVLGISYMMLVMTSVSASVLWITSILLFVATLVFEIGIFKFGPSNSKAKALTLVPLTFIGFSIILALVGYNPVVVINWKYWTIALSYLATMVFCWLYVLDYAGWEVFKSKTGRWMTVMAVVAVAFSVLGMLQGWGLTPW
jgi:hypothetical protein